MYFYWFCSVHFKQIWCTFESCHMVDSLSDWPSIILVCTGSFQYDVTFLRFSLLWSHGATALFYQLLFLNYHFDNFPIFGVTIKFSLLIGWKQNHRVFWWMHWLKLLQICLQNRHLQSFCIVEWLWLGCNFRLGSFLVHLMEFLLAYLPECHLYRYCSGGCFYEYFR